MPLQPGESEGPRLAYPPWQLPAALHPLAPAAATLCPASSHWSALPPACVAQVLCTLALRLRDCRRLCTAPLHHPRATYMHTPAHQHDMSLLKLAVALAYSVAVAVSRSLANEWRSLALRR